MLLVPSVISVIFVLRSYSSVPVSPDGTPPASAAKPPPMPVTAPGQPGGEMLRPTGEMRRDPLAFLVRMRAEPGDVLQFPIPTPATYLVSDPDAVRRVLVTNARAYGKRTPQYSSLSLVTGEGLLTADTAAWRPQRTLVQPAFHRSALDLVARHVTDAVDRLMATWRYLDGHVVDADAAMMHLALEVVGESLFGSDLSGEADELARQDERPPERGRGARVVGIAQGQVAQGFHGVGLPQAIRDRLKVSQRFAVLILGLVQLVLAQRHVAQRLSLIHL